MGPKKKPVEKSPSSNDDSGDIDKDIVVPEKRERRRVQAGARIKIVKGRGRMEVDEGLRRSGRSSTAISTAATKGVVPGTSKGRGRGGGGSKPKGRQLLNKSNPRDVNDTTQKDEPNTTVVRSRENMTVSSATTEGSWKKELVQFIKIMLDKAQRSFKSYERKKLFKEFRKEFYKDENPKTANEWQKYIIQMIWSWGILFFKAPNSQPVSCALKFIQDLILRLGTSEDKDEVGFKLETYPMYYYVLKLFFLSHKDERALVRLRLINIVHQILKRYRNMSPVQGNVGLNKQLLDALMIRLTDRNASVRAVAGATLKYYAIDNVEVVRRLKYFVRYDPSPEVRRTLIMAFFDMENIKTTFFYDFAFDTDARVRVEALTALAGRPMSQLSFEQRSKVLTWGLSRDDRMKKVVAEKLIPAWLNECEGSHIVFLKGLSISRKPGVVTKILDAIFPDNFSERFEALDLSFLNEDKLVSLKELSAEMCLYWGFLVKKFGISRFNKEKLLPSAEVLIACLRKIIGEIHTEHQRARTENRDEDASLLYYIPYFIPIIFQAGLEEANRRNFVDLLKEMLLDSVLDEAPIIKICTDSLFKITSKHTFTGIMTEVLQDVFEPDKTIVEEDVHSPASQPENIHAAPNGVNGEDEVMDHDGEAQGEEQKKSVALPSTSSASNVSDTPKKRVYTEKEILAMKNKLCELALQRLRLNEEKAQAIECDNFLEAHRLQKDIEIISHEEQVVRNKMETTSGTVGSMSDFLLTTKDPRDGNADDTSMMEMEAPSYVDSQSPRPPPTTVPSSRGSSAKSGHSNRTLQAQPELGHGQPDYPLSQATTAGGRVGITNEHILKAVLMVNRFLTCCPKIIPIIRQFYENFAMSQFADTFHDSRTRVELFNFLCLVGLIDTGERRKSMGVAITAMTHDSSPDVRAAAYKGIVDLLCHYKMVDFIYRGEGDTTFEFAPLTFNDPDATLTDMQRMFVQLVDSFGIGDVNTPDYMTVKTEGLLKLLISERIISETAVADLLCLWATPAHQSTKIPYHVGIWLPIYTKVSVQNARLTMKGLFESVLRILAAQDGKAKYAELVRANYMRLVDFVLPYLSSAHLQHKDGEYVNMQEELMQKIIEHITTKTKLAINVDLIQILPKLSIENETVAERIVGEMGYALVKLSGMIQTPSVVAVKVALKKSGARIASRFEEIQDELLRQLGRADAIDDQGDESDISDEPHPFSDDDEGKENMSRAPSLSSTLSRGTRSRPRRDSDCDDLEMASKLTLDEDINLKDEDSVASTQETDGDDDDAVSVKSKSSAVSGTSSRVGRGHFIRAPRLANRDMRVQNSSDEDEDSD